MPSSYETKDAMVPTIEDTPANGRLDKSRQRKATGSKGKAPELISLTRVTKDQITPDTHLNVARADSRREHGSINRPFSRPSDLPGQQESSSNQATGGLQRNVDQEFDLTMSIGGMTCAACTNSIKRALRGIEYIKSINVDLMTNSARVHFSGPGSLSVAIIEAIEDIGYEASIVTCIQVNPTVIGATSPSDAELDFIVELTIGNMSSVSCSNTITDGLHALPFVKTVKVLLMRKSGFVTFHGRDHLNEIVEKVKALGYECSWSSCVTVRGTDSLETNPLKRTVELRIDGMFSDEHPSQVLESLRVKHPGLIEVVKQPTMKEPFIVLSYQSNAPTFTIRDIVSTINSTKASFRATFKATIHHPPSIEDRSRAIQKRERAQIYRRLVLTFVVAIPTFLIGVVWMDLVPSSNKVRKFFDTPRWIGTVSGAEWALLILSTPVMFCAADVFHRRAIKEIRILWRKSSTVPIFRRFYRFGSMNLLISAGTSVAYFASLALIIIGITRKERTEEHKTYFDSVVFLTLFILVGRYLEVYSKSKAGDAVDMLGKLQPQEALLVIQPASDESDSVSPTTEKSDTEIHLTETSDIESHTTEVDLIGLPKFTTINAEMLEVGDTVLVRKGSSPPADGRIVSGSAQFNESSLTGESKTVQKDVGAKVYIGTINAGNAISMEVTEIGGDSMLEEIVKVVREGLSKRAPVERLADVLTAYFVPIITALAIITFFVWFALGQSGALSSRYIDGQTGGWGFWSLEFAIAVFVVACPCGIGLAAPTALFVGNGLAAKHGILVRGGGEAFQEAGNIDAVVFDKTGTLTEGTKLKVTERLIYVEDKEAEIAWTIARMLEEQSSHPIAKAIAKVASAEKKPSFDITLDEMTEEAGLGVRGIFTVPKTRARKSTKYEAALGSEDLMSALDPQLVKEAKLASMTLSTWKARGESVAVLAMREMHRSDAQYTEGRYSWSIAVLFATSDPIRPSAYPTVRNLQGRGLSVYMLTGDNPQTAMSVAISTGIPLSNIFAGVLPTGKVEKIKWLQENSPLRSSNKAQSKWTRIFKRLSGQSRRQDNPSRRPARIMFVGDGINDAAALASANISVSLSTGSPIAHSSSSFILMSPSLTTIPLLLDLSKRVFDRIKFNFVWALLYNLLLVPVAAGVLFGVSKDGWRLGPVWASAAMAASSLSVVLSSIMLKWETSTTYWRPDQVRQKIHFKITATPATAPVTGDRLV